VSHEKVKSVFGLHARRLFGRLARTTTTNAIFIYFKSNIIVLSQKG
jgi:hypothetical protein